MEWQDNGLSDGRGDLFDETLGKSMRWWATETSDGRLLLRRSVMIRSCALLALAVGVPGMVYNALPLMSPYITDYEVKDAMIWAIMFSIPAVWAINTLRRRTVLSQDGIAMRRLLFTERRPWASVGSRFTLSTLNLTDGPSSYGGFIERTRIAIENGDGDDAIRLPGCVIGMTWGSSEDRAAAAVGDLQYYIYARGWGVSEEAAVSEDPHLVVARGRHGAEKMLQRSRLVFCTPLWRRIKEHLCNGGLFLIGMGVLFLVIGGQQLSSARTGDHGVSALQDLRVLPAGCRGRAGDSRGKTLVRLAGVPLRTVRCGGPDLRRLWQWEAPGHGWRRCHVGELSAPAGAAGRQV